MYDRILLPTDGSAGMDRVIDHAGALADVHGAAIDAVSVVDTASLTDLPLETSWEGLRSALDEEAETALSSVRSRVTDVPLETHRREGTPVTEILEFARSHPIDVIVMGTHGRAGVERWLLGSVAERVVRRSPVPVLTVRVAAPAARD